MVLKVRETLIAQRTTLINTVRGHASEFGIIAGKGVGKIVPLLSAIEQEAAIPPEGREMFVLLGHQIDEIDARIKKLISTLRRAQGQRGQPASRLYTGRRTDHCINAGCRDQPGDVPIRPPSRRLGRPDNKGTFDRRQTTNGRHQPGRQRTVARVAGFRCHLGDQCRPEAGQPKEWLRALLLRKPRKLAAVALANKMARTAWAMMTSGETYRPPSIAAGAVARMTG
jgi:transposase